MKTATVREVQHGLSAVLGRVARGEEITITKHGRPVARITPAASAKKTAKLRWPDAMGRLRLLFPDGPLPGKPASALIDEMRGRGL